MHFFEFHCISPTLRFIRSKYIFVLRWVYLSKYTEQKFVTKKHETYFWGKTFVVKIGYHHKCICSAICFIIFKRELIWFATYLLIAKLSNTLTQEKRCIVASFLLKRNHSKDEIRLAVATSVLHIEPSKELQLVAVSKGVWKQLNKTLFKTKKFVFKINVTHNVC